MIFTCKLDSFLRKRNSSVPRGGEKPCKHDISFFYLEISKRLASFLGSSGRGAGIFAGMVFCK